MTQIIENNETLRQFVVDADELHRRVHHQQQTSSASRRRTESSRLATKVLEQLAEFEKNVAFMSSSSGKSNNNNNNNENARRFSSDKFFQDIKLSVPVNQLNDPSQTSNTDAIFNLQKAIQRLAQLQAQFAKKQGEDPEQDGIDSSSSFYGTHRFLNERAPELINKCIELHRQAPLQSEVWASIPDALLLLFDDMITCRSTEAVLTESEEARKRLAFDVEELSHQQGQAISDGDMKAAEELYFKKVAVQESMVPLFEQMNSQLDEHQHGVVMEPAARAQEILKRANDDIAAIAGRNEERKKSLQTDAKALMATQKLLTDEDRELRQRFTRLRSDSDAYLKENLSEMERCYNAMEELERHIARLAAERSDALQRRLQADIQEAQRVADLDNFYSFSKQHKLLLDTSLNTVNASDEVTDIFHELISSGSNAISQRIKSLESDIETMRITLHEQRLSQFRSLYLTLGDLQYKKERNLEELDKKIEQVHIQQEIAMDTFNPKAKDLANAKKELISIREEMQSQVDVIHDKAQLQIEYFKPTEEALIEAGKEFVHPVDELNQKNEQRQMKLLEYHNLMKQQAEDEGTGAGVGGGGTAAVEEELKKIEDLKRSVQPYHHSSSARASSARAAVQHNHQTTTTTTTAAGYSSNENSPERGASAGLD